MDKEIDAIRKECSLCQQSVGKELTELRMAMWGRNGTNGLNGDMKKMQITVNKLYLQFWVLLTALVATGVISFKTLKEVSAAGNPSATFLQEAISE